MPKTKAQIVWILVVVNVMAMGIPSCEADFKDCYTKCFIFCIIEPSQSLCSCTTHCLKECIFSELPRRETSSSDGHHISSDNLGFCKLGCSFSMCSTMSTRLKPNEEKVDECVGSCSTKCTNTYSLP